MNRPRIARAAVRWLGIATGVVALLATLGCTAYYRSRGDRAAARGDWDTAYSRYQSALSRDPASAELTEKLALARRQATQQHREAGVRAQDQGRLGEALRELEASLRYENDEATRRRFEQVLAAKKLEESEAALTDAAVLERRGELGASAEAYKRAVSLNPRLAAVVQPRLDGVLQRISQADAIASRARIALERGDFDEAEHIAGQALDIHASEPTATQILKRIRAERKAAAAEDEALQALRSREYDVAVEEARAAQAAAPSDERERLVKRTERQAFEAFREQSRRAYERRDYDDAIHAIEQARSYGGEPYALSDELEDAQYQRYLQLGRRAERDHDRDEALRNYRAAYRLRATEALAERIHTLESPPAKPPPRNP